jgi:hypothetical protein
MAIRKVISRSILDGTVAPIDTTGTASNISLTALSASIAATATAVFVYDTRKDSDGGAWRKRTSQTSWYNETLNTATRGSRREFPAVAVLVGSAAGLTIYDGDSPDLPMWMVFNSASSNPIEAAPPKSITALNGTVFTGSNNGTANSALSELCFIHDSCRLHQDTAVNQTKLPFLFMSLKVRRSFATSYLIFIYMKGAV